MVIIPRRLGFMRKWPSAAGVWNEQRLRLPRAFSFVYSFMSFSIYIYQRLLHHSRCVCHQQRRVTLPWALRLCLRGKVGGKTRITPFDFILVDFPYFWRSRGGFRKKNFCSILLLLIPSFVEGSKTEIGVQGVPKRWPAKGKYSPKLIAVRPNFPMGMTWGRLIQLLTKWLKTISRHGGHPVFLKLQFLVFKMCTHCSQVIGVLNFPFHLHHSFRVNFRVLIGGKFLLLIDPPRGWIAWERRMPEPQSHSRIQTRSHIIVVQLCPQVTAHKNIEKKK